MILTFLISMVNKGNVKSRFSQFLILFLLPSIYIIIKVSIYRNLVPITYNDSKSYLAAPYFFRHTDIFNVKPFTVSFIYKLLLDNVNRIITFQFIYTTMSWLLLILTLHYCIEDKIIRVVIPITFMLFSLSNSVLQWDALILSESLMISLFLNIITLVFFM